MVLKVGDGKLKKIQNYIEEKFHENIRYNKILEAEDGQYDPFPSELNDTLKAILTDQGISSLYKHQRDAFDSIIQGNDTVLVSRTASGKTLSFFLPLLHEYIEEKNPFSVLLLYPTKALSRDQESTFGKLLQAAGQSQCLGTFDGDTPRDERQKIITSSDFIITNPDMLHSGILPNHNRKWKTFLSRLKYIVVDEVHMYRGAFGSHVANVFRRLQRICELHGSSPVFICSSATIGNPQKHVEALFQRPFTLIDNDTSPRPNRHLYFLNPSLQESQGHALYRKGTASLSIPILRKALLEGIRTICFCRSRQEVERLYRAVTDGRPDLRKKIQPYRGGLLPNERRKLERDLFEGRITCIISTNALEVGIDIGDLQLCILSGHPGTVASFWQQGGRVGRGDRDAMVIYIAKDSAIDQFLVHHPEYIEDTPAEEAWLSADNPYIFLQHLPCAAHEFPLAQKEGRFPQDLYDVSREILLENKTLKPYQEYYRYSLHDYPSRGVNLRGMTDYNVEIFCGTEVIGEIDPIGARGTIYKDAIYQHLGKRFMSMELDLEKKLCRVEPVEVDYYTEAVWQGSVEMIDKDESQTINGSDVSFGEIHINKQPKIYKKIRERSLENIGYGPITLSAFEYDTTGFCLVPPKSWVTSINEEDKRFSGAALHGLSYILRHSAPSLCMADIKDIDTDVALIDEVDKKWQSSLYVYDTVEGGVGYSERIYQRIEEALHRAETIIDECECMSGCPACVPPLPPGVNSEEMEELLTITDAAIQCTRSLITFLLKGNFSLPNITITSIIAPKPEEKKMPDKDAILLKKKLRRAAGTLQRKRERLH